jgi:uncharacterized protein YdgA (DUF945 family)
MLSRKTLKVGVALGMLAFALGAQWAAADQINSELAGALKDANASGKQLVANCFATW